VGQALLSDRINLPDMLAGKAYVMSCVVNLPLGDTLTRIFVCPDLSQSRARLS